MMLKTLQWNIGGAFVRGTEDDATKEESYAVHSLEYIADVIGNYDPDIVTLQETHEKNDISQVSELARMLEYDFYLNDTYDISHLDPTYKLGQGIISRFPMEGHSFVLYENPKLQITRPNGEVWNTHDKGVSSCLVDCSENIKIQVVTTHLVPFIKFGKSFDHVDIQKVLQDVDKKISTYNNPILLQGDFNYDEFSLKKLLPTLFSKGVEEVLQTKPTTPKGRKYDHVVYKGLRLVDSMVVTDVLTDHFPIFSTFEIEN